MSKSLKEILSTPIKDTTVDILSHTYQMHSTSNNIKREK